MKRPALFLDRDGVINVDHGYVHRREEFEFIDGVFDLARTARALGFAIVVVTNQAGIGRGYYSEDDFHALTDWMKDRFAAEGAPLTSVHFCPDHPEHGIGPYKRASVRRKPGPGMLLDAARTDGIDLGASAMIGDNETDVEAGLAAGLPFVVRFGAAASATRAHAVASSHRECGELLRAWSRTRAASAAQEGMLHHAR